MTATLLPNAKQQFIGGNGVPLAGGSVYFYVTNTNTPKNTWKDAGETILNTNPIVLDASGEAIIYGSGQYRQVVFDSNGNLIWDALTQDVTQALQSSVALFCGTSAGSANAQTLSPLPAVISITTGQQFSFFAGFTNTNVMVITISSLTYNVYFGGLAAPANYVQAGSAILIEFDGTNMQLVNPYQLPIPGSSGNLLQSNGSAWTSATPLLPSPGTSGNILTSNGSAWTSATSTTYIRTVKQQIFTSTGTYTPSSGLLYCIVECVGGGGGGGGTSSGIGGITVSGGGGGGGYGKSLLSASSVGSSKTVTIGSAGTAGVGSATGGVGGTGGTTSFGALVTGVGGIGGAGTGNAASQAILSGGSGGTATGQLNFSGQSGGASIFISTTSGISGFGASSFYGAGGISLIAVSAGQSGQGYGAGGGGSFAGASSSANGGSGAAGIVIVTEYCYQ